MCYKQKCKVVSLNLAHPVGLCKDSRVQYVYVILAIFES